MLVLLSFNNSCIHRFFHPTGLFVSGFKVEPKELQQRYNLLGTVPVYFTSGTCLDKAKQVRLSHFNEWKLSTDIPPVSPTSTKLIGTFFLRLFCRWPPLSIRNAFRKVIPVVNPETTKVVPVFIIEVNDELVQLFLCNT